jgi:lipopolysaccharide biosynthesis glycosyltransferase
MNIAFACNDNYAELTCVAMCSIIKNTKRDVHFYVVDSDISEASKAKMLALGAPITFRQAIVSVSQAPVSNWISAETYLKLFLPDIFPELDKLLYVDSDIVVTGDTGDCYDINIDGKYAAALPTYTAEKASVLGHGQYYNAGVLLLNCEKLRESNTAKNILLIADLLFKMWERLGWRERWRPEQEVFNYLYADSVTPLPLRANILPSRLWGGLRSYSLDECVDAINRPLCIHFGGAEKPHTLRRRLQSHKAYFVGEYYKYKAMTGFANEAEDVKSLAAYQRLEAEHETGLVSDGAEYVQKNALRAIKDFIRKGKSSLNGRKMIIYGAGQYIYQIVAYLTAAGLKPSGIMDGMEHNVGREIYDYIVEPALKREMTDKYTDRNCFYLICATNVKPAREIAAALGGADCEHIFGCLWSEFETL